MSKSDKPHIAAQIPFSFLCILDEMKKNYDDNRSKLICIIIRNFIQKQKHLQLQDTNESVHLTFTLSPKLLKEIKSLTGKNNLFPSRASLVREAIRDYLLITTTTTTPKNEPLYLQTPKQQPKQTSKQETLYLDNEKILILKKLM